MKRQVTAAQALKQMAAEFDAKAEEERQDWMRVLISAGARSRIDTLAEAARMCRIAALKSEEVDRA